MKAARRYFVSEGPETEAFCTALWADLERSFRMTRELEAEHGAAAMFIRDGKPIAFGFNDNATRHGLKFRKEKLDGFYYASPRYNVKVGLAIAERMQACAPAGSASDQIVRRHKASRMVMQPDLTSRSGMSMAVTVGHPLDDKKRYTLNVPVDPSDPFQPDGELREIKKSEYVALTEE